MAINFVADAGILPKFTKGEDHEPKDFRRDHFRDPGKCGVGLFKGSDSRAGNSNNSTDANGQGDGHYGHAHACYTGPGPADLGSGDSAAIHWLEAA